MKYKKFYISLLIISVMSTGAFAEDMYYLLKNMDNVNYEDTMLRTIYSNQQNNGNSSYEIKGYHDSDDKSAFWIPQNVNPLMMTNQELEQYRIIKNLELYNNDFYRHYMQKAKQQNRPFLPADVQAAKQDQNALYGGITGGGIIDSLRDKDGRLGRLSIEEEKTLQRLIDEYGANNPIFNDEELKRLLRLYRQRQEYIKNNPLNLTQKEKEFQWAEQKKQLQPKENDSLFSPYMNELQRRIKMNWDPPKCNENRRVVLLFSIAKDGKLLNVKIYSSSGILALDNAAIDAVKRTAPFRPLPELYKGESVDIKFSFDYKLNGIAITQY